jgi:FtsP/CotA-like multicopper oxidase with cupredoxin domain
MSVWRASTVVGIASAAIVLLGATSSISLDPNGAPSAGARLSAEPVVFPQHGVTTLSLVVRTDASGRDYYEYRGQPRPPTIHVVPGGRLNVTLSNQMNPLSSEACVMHPCPQNTNLHFHGMEVSPRRPADDVLTMLASPGHQLSYTVVIPKTHPAGLFWYHPHPHGESNRQVEDGMAGAIIVDGIERYAPQVRGLRERVLVVRDNEPRTAMTFLKQTFAQVKVAVANVFGGIDVTQSPVYCGLAGASSQVQTRFASFVAQTSAAPVLPPVSPEPDTHCRIPPENVSDSLTIDGISQPTIDLAPGERQFWRIVNASADMAIDIDMGSTFEIVALDGVPRAVRYPHQPLQRVTHLLIPPAGRLEAIVTGPPAGANRILRSRCVDLGADGDPNPEMLLARLGSASEAPGRTSSEEVKTTLPLATEPRGVPAAELREPAQVITFTENHLGFYVNGHPFDMLDGPVIRAKVGGLEHWQVVNSTNEVHPFHIHQIHFLVFAQDGKREIEPAWRDTFNVQPQSTVDLVMDITNPAIRGLAVLHCHILSHEDKGMMAKVLFQ